MAEIDSALGRAFRRTGGCLQLEGPAGIGKSRLLAAAVELAARKGMAVVAGRATELDRVAPLSALLVALCRSDPPVLDGAGVSALGGPEGSRLLLIDRVGDAIKHYAGTRPLLVVLDDEHWADEFTALALRMLIPVLRSAPVLWLLARRPLPARSPVQHTLEWLVEHGARRLPLGRSAAHRRSRADRRSPAVR